ncbi:hypothetical protein [Mesorhizobium sp.]|uniref:hypothetical protein n=1 Tax=Mesorhizobium sp. TaxID=1871066 RepID=UPI00257D4520|nr:hypothetical protein [Mesorhizobium sp.]
MGFLDKRRSKRQPAEIRAAQQEARRQIAVAGSAAKGKTQAEVLAALAVVLAKSDNA